MGLSSRSRCPRTRLHRYGCTYLVIRAPEPGVEQFIDEVRACHRTIWHVGHDTVAV